MNWVAVLLLLSAFGQAGNHERRTNSSEKSGEFISTKKPEIRDRSYSATDNFQNGNTLDSTRPFTGERDYLPPEMIMDNGKKYLPIPSSSKAVTEVQEQSESTGIPKNALFFSITPGSEINSSQLYGLEIQGNVPMGTSAAIGIHGMLQSQKYGPMSVPRWGLGISLNYYMQLGAWKPYIGVKRTYYGSFGGSNEKALDCLNCSDHSESYSGGESFASIGTNIGTWTVQIDSRISDDRSAWSEGAYDPWGVGANWSKSYSGVPDPKVIIQIGTTWK